jgi:CheY-like chemotaxis protein
MFSPSDISPDSAPQVLVVDDSPTIRKIMECCHRRAGFSIRTFADGVQALQWFSAHPALLPSLIYLDIEMPRMDGFEVLLILRARPVLVNVPVLMFSGRDQTLDRLKSRLAGAKGHVTKPFREQDILALTRSYLLPLASVAAVQ